MPPSNFKKYPSIEFPKNFEINEQLEMKSTIFGFESTARQSIVENKPFTPSKISYRETHPDYEKVLLEQNAKGNVSEASRY